MHIECESGSNEYIQFQYSPYEMEVLAGETKTGTLKASMLKLVDEEREIPITCEIVAEAKERETLGDEYFEPFSKSGMLMKAPAKNNQSEDAKFWKYRYNISEVIFENKLIPHETSEGLIFDVSSNQDKSVMAYLILREDKINKTTDLYGNVVTDNDDSYTLYIQSDTGVFANIDSGSLFDSFYNLKNIANMQYFDTDRKSVV